ncbi:MAG: HU family DNA-binding protein [Patescibacteria group bacterium]|jgi:DNA-binding protein HU-beta
MPKMTKAKMVAGLAEELGSSKKEVSNFLDVYSEMVYKEVKKNGECIVPGFGKLVKAKRKAREGRNPATGETIKIPAKTVVKFRLSKAVKDAIL